jgi:hypothetical protein
MRFTSSSSKVASLDPPQAASAIAATARTDIVTNLTTPPLCSSAPGMSGFSP